MKKKTAVIILFIAAIASYAIYKSDSNFFRTVKKEVAQTFGVRPGDVLSEILDEPVEAQKDTDSTVDVNEKSLSATGVKQQRPAPVIAMDQPSELPEDLKTGVASLEFRDDALEQEGMDAPAKETLLTDDAKSEKSAPEVARLEFRDDALEQEGMDAPAQETLLTDDAKSEQSAPEVARLEFRNDALEQEDVNVHAMGTLLPVKKPDSIDITQPKDVLEKADVNAPAMETLLPATKTDDGDIAAFQPADTRHMAEVDKGDVLPEEAPVREMDAGEGISGKEEPVKDVEPALMPDSAEAIPEELLDEATAETIQPITSLIEPGEDLAGNIVETEEIVPGPPFFEDVHEELNGDDDTQKETERAAAARTRAVAELGESIALLPFDNLSENSDALETVMPVIRSHLRDKGFTLMFDDILSDFLCEERVKGLGYISSKLALKGRDTLKIKAFITGSVVAYSDGDNPEVGILARMIDASSGDIVWADYASLSGDEFTTLLGLGTIRDINELTGKTVDKMLSSLSLDRAPSPSGTTRKVAVMPFRNNTGHHGAGMIATYMFMVELFKNRIFSPAEFGDVRFVVVASRIREMGNLEYSNMNAFSDHLDAGAVLVGSVDYYSNGKNTTVPPKVGITARLLDTKSKKILWYSTREVHGEEDIIAFDWGKVRTADAVAYKVVSSLLQNMGESKWNGYAKKTE